MSITIGFASKEVSDAPGRTFDDSHLLITLGRAPSCDFVLPPMLTMVGHEHCRIRRDAGKYFLLPSEHYRLGVDGRALTSTAPVALVRSHVIQLGFDGPRIVVSPGDDDVIPPTDMDDRVELAEPAQVRWRRLAYAGCALTVIFAIAGVQLYRRTVGLEHAFGAVSQRATPSVYLVLHRDRDQVAQPIATAWVWDHDRGLLVTNAHVVDDLELAAPQGAFVRQAETGREHAVKAVRVHAGYADFRRLWAEYQPLPKGSTDAGAPGNLDFLSPACDVAILEVDDPEQLGPELLIADRPALEGLAPGVEVLSIGFPQDGRGLEGGVDPAAPTPTAQIGYLQAVTDYFGHADVPGPQRLLIQHSASSSKGSSGSPLLDRQGRVLAVHSSGTDIGLTSSAVHVGSSANIFYAQRADLVLDLGKDDKAAQRSREASWPESIQRAFTSRRDAANNLAVADLFAAVKDHFSHEGFDLADMDPSRSQLIDSNPQRQDKVESLDWQSPATGRFLLFALSPLHEECALAIETDAAGGSQRREFHAFGSRKWLKYAIVHLVAGEHCQIRLGPQPNPKVEIRAFLLKCDPQQEARWQQQVEEDLTLE